MITINITNTQPRYSLRKLNIGVVTFVIGLTVLGVQQAKADTVTNNNRQQTKTNSTNIKQPYTTQQATPQVENNIHAITPAQNDTVKTIPKTQSNSAYLDNKYEDDQPVLDIPENTNNFADHYNPQTVNISQDYINDLPKVTNQESSDQMEAKDPNYSNFYRNSYQFDPVAASEKIDINHLTGDQLLQINLYSTRLINQIRAKFNMNPYKLNPKVIQRAQENAIRAGQMKSTNHESGLLTNLAGENLDGRTIYTTINNDHPHGDLQKASDFTFTKSDDDNRYAVFPAHAITTMDDLQADVFYCIMNMLFADAGINQDGHARQFLTLYNNPNEYMALGIENFINDNNNHIMILRWIFSDTTYYPVDQSLDYNVTPTTNSTYQTTDSTNISRTIYVNTPSGIQTYQQTTSLTRTNANDPNSGQTSQGNYRGTMPAYFAPDLPGLTCLNPDAGKAVNIDTDQPKDLPSITFNYANTSDVDYYKFYYDISYNKPDGSTAAHSKVTITGYRTKNGSGYNDYDLNNVQISVDGIPLKSVTIPQRKYTDTIPGWLEFEITTTSDPNEVAKYLPGYKMSTSPSTTIPFDVYDTQDALNGQYAEKSNATIQIVPANQYVNVNYIDRDTNQVVKVDHLAGKTDESTYYNGNLPDNYSLVSGNTDFSYTFEPNQPDINIYVENLGQRVQTKATYIYVDDDNNDSQVGSPANFTGYARDTQYISLSLPANYQLATNETLPTEVTFTGQDQTHYIHLIHKKIQLDDNDPLNHTYRDLITHYYYANGPKAGQKARPDSILRYYGHRQAVEDLVTGNISGSWSLDTSKGQDGYQVLSGNFTYPTSYSASSYVTDDTDEYSPIAHYHLAFAPANWYNIPNNSMNHVSWHEFNTNPNLNEDNPYTYGGYTFHNNGGSNDAIHNAYYIQNQATLIIDYTDSNNNVVSQVNTTQLSGDTYSLLDNLPQGYKLAPKQSATITVPDYDAYITVSIIKPTITIGYYDMNGNLISRDTTTDLSSYNPRTPYGYKLITSQNLPNSNPNEKTEFDFTIVPKIEETTQTKTITRQINIHTPAGTISTIFQSLNFYRTISNNLANATTTYSIWQPEDNDYFDAFIPPVLPGYTNDIAYGQYANPNHNQTVIDLYYYKQPKNTYPIYIDTDGNRYNTLPDNYQVIPGQTTSQGSLLIVPKTTYQPPKLTFYTRTIYVTMPNGNQKTIIQKALKGSYFNPPYLPYLKGHRKLVLSGNINSEIADSNQTAYVMYM